MTPLAIRSLAGSGQPGVRGTPERWQIVEVKLKSAPPPEPRAVTPEPLPAPVIRPAAKVEELSAPATPPVAKPQAPPVMPPEERRAPSNPDPATTRPAQPQAAPAERVEERAGPPAPVAPPPSAGDLLRHVRPW
jgi:hypothetical protein